MQQNKQKLPPVGKLTLSEIKIDSKVNKSEGKKT
jgi:hypothetical protein